ncbi:DUF2171 domain-containing protein [Deinococcus lacus]|uniref:DUF2171 domain-containing protein n=1 Tax=Deinococcus lacus TaxID=392561 RepID=A0ABW1YAA4_9DEIO
MSNQEMREMEQILDAEMRAKIVEHLQIKDAEGEHVGTVDRLEGEQIKLTKTDSMDGKHHYIKLSDVRSVDDIAVYLNKRRSELHY